MCIKKQRGSAATEMLVLLMVMVPLFSALPLLGKISDINTTTIQSSRYLAWERTVSNSSHKTAAHVATEVNNRFFVQPDAHIKSNQGVLSSEEVQNPFWRGFGENHNGEKNRLITSNEGSYVSSSDWNRTARPPGLVGELSSGLQVFSDAFSVMSGKRMNLEWKGLVTTTVGQDIASNQFLPSSRDCRNQESNVVFSCIKYSNTILVDTWNAQHNTDAVNKTHALVPTRGLKGVSDALATVGSVIPVFYDLKYLKTDGNGGFGYVHSQMVPLDRYVAP